MKLYLVKSPESDDLPLHKDDSENSATINLRSIAKGRSFENNYVRGRGWANRDKHRSGQWSDRNTWRQQWRHLVRRGRFWRGSIKPHLQHADLRPERGLRPTVNRLRLACKVNWHEFWEHSWQHLVRSGFVRVRGHCRLLKWKIERCL